MKQKIQIQYYHTKVGELLLGAFKDQLCICDWRYRKKRDAVDSRIKKVLHAEFEEKDSKVLQHTRQQLDEYFGGTRTTFNLPTLLVGSDFQKSVWDALQTIPYGEKRSYLELSHLLGNAKAVRAVAAANGANAIAIIVPCHRIVGSGGKLVGYAGGLKAKQQLLHLESLKTQYKLDLFSELK